MDVTLQLRPPSTNRVTRLGSTFKHLPSREREAVSADNYIRITSFPTQSPKHKQAADGRLIVDAGKILEKSCNDAPRHHPSWLLDCFCGWLCLSLALASGTSKKTTKICRQRKRAADAQKCQWPDANATRGPNKLSRRPSDTVALKCLITNMCH